MITKFSINADLVRELSSLLDETGLSEIEYEVGGRRIRVRRDGAPAATVISTAPPPAGEAPPAAIESPSDSAHPGAITSPMVGTVYMAPEPSAPPYVRAGDAVREGQTLMIVEAMKTMNPILAGRSGTVSRILVTNGDPVEYGEVLMIIE